MSFRTDAIHGRGGNSGTYGNTEFGMRRTTCYGLSRIHHTAAPHSSDLASKADPRVNSDCGKLAKS